MFAPFNRAGCTIVLAAALGLSASAMSAPMSAPAAGLQPAGFRLGSAAEKITPPAQGFPFQAPQRPDYKPALSTGVHDDLWAKALVFDDGSNRAALVACDLTSLTGSIATTARRLIARNTDIPAENVIITATHTHTGPQIRERFFGPEGTPERALAQAYIARLPELIAKSVERAEASLAPAETRAAIARAEGLSFNRRFMMRDGTVESNPGKDDPARLSEIVRPAGPTDSDVPLVYWQNAGKPVAALVNFSMHADTTGTSEFSADYPYTLGERLARAQHCAGLLTVFTIGAAGNVNHYFLLDPQKYRRSKGYDEAERIGSRLAAAALDAWSRASRLRSTPLRAGRTLVRLEMAQEKGDRLRIALAGPDDDGFFDGEVFVSVVAGRYYFDAEVQAIALGDELAMVALPGEPFVELGLAIKLGSPYRYTIVEGLAGGTIGYVPDRKALAQGGYGASPTTTRVAPGSGEALVDAAVRLLVELRYGAGDRVALRLHTKP